MEFPFTFVSPHECHFLELVDDFRGIAQIFYDGEGFGLDPFAISAEHSGTIEIFVRRSHGIESEVDRIICMDRFLCGTVSQSIVPDT
jgi:hypothetical protein